MRMAAILILAACLVGMAAVPSPARAIGLFMPFAGRVVLPAMPPVICTGGFGPITIRPFGIAPPSFYGTYPATFRYLNYVPKPGDVIIGLYNPIPNPLICGIPNPTGIPPMLPFPTFPIIFFGTSLVPGL